MSHWMNEWCLGLMIGFVVVIFVGVTALLMGQPTELLHLRATGAPRWPDWIALCIFATLWASVRVTLARNRAS